jgi:3-deoxy-D-manno-octulosonate 8-phosphate phosphatase (KDO 8-P phosphatase)
VIAVKRLSREELKERLAKVKLLALDVDGVLTDDSIFFGPDGFEMKRFNISDGLFMVLAMRAGLELAIVSGRHSSATDTRMKDLGVKHVLQGRSNKVEMIKPLLEQLGLQFSDIAFVGNEILDIQLVQQAGVGIAVADSSDDLLAVADYVTEKPGGCGAVRELIECYFEAVQRDPKSFLK